MAQSKKWCFTIHAHDGAGGEDALRAEFDNMGGANWGVYGGAQLERAPDTNRLHIQGFALFATNKRLAALKKVHATAHWEVMRGKLEDSEQYCSKEDSREPGTAPRTWGDRPALAQGKRNDLAEAITALQNAGGTVKDQMRAVAEAEPVAYVKYFKGLEALARALAPRPKFDLPNPRRWQKDLLLTLQGTADDRTILWYTDYEGGAGKSTVVRYAIAKGPAISLTGKLADMAYAYNGEPVVFFDVTRTQAEHMDHLYQFAEQLKNGIIFSSKYESGTKTFEPPWVVFFANQGPHPGKWSADRCVERILNAADKEHTTWEEPVGNAIDINAPGMQIFTPPEDNAQVHVVIA